MARSLFIAAALAPFAAGLLIGGSLALPALAQPAAVTSPADPAALDLEAIPVQPVKGPLSVKGVAGEDDDDAPGATEGGRSHHGDAYEAENEGHGHDDGDGDGDGDFDE